LRLYAHHLKLVKNFFDLIENYFAAALLIKAWRAGRETLAPTFLMRVVLQTLFSLAEFSLPRSLLSRQIHFATIAIRHPK
jgi:hypothetical protein